MAPAVDGVYDVGEADRRWASVYAYYGDFAGNVTVQGRPVLKDGDPVTVMYFEGPAKEVIDAIYSNTLRPSSIITYVLSVGTAPIPLSDLDIIARRIHLKAPRSNVYLVYVGGSDNQDYILEPGDIDVLEVQNPRNVYVRSLGEAKIHVMIEE